MSCGIGHRFSSDLALLWLWHRLEAAAPVQPLAWELPYAKSTALKKTQQQQKAFFKNPQWVPMTNLSLPRIFFSH